MKFYNREKEIALLQQIEALSSTTAQMTFVTGRRRIGKTSLLLKATDNKKLVYLFVTKKSESLLCQEFAETIENSLGVQLFGKITKFSELFDFLLSVSKKQSFSLIIDEFQEFFTINESIYSEMQKLWDANKSESKLNLILCGSIYSLMTKIFQNSKEPLFGRATQRLHVKPFDLATLKEILNEYSPNYSKEDLLAFYTFTGGVAKYVELLVQAKAFTLEDILSVIFSDNSLFLDEGKNVLIDEFGKEYGNYFSILSLIASGKTARNEIESILETPIGGFLDRLENNYGIITKVRPILAKPNSRKVKYRIEDNFLRFWFRFIYKNRSAIEIGNLEYVRAIVYRDYPTYSGLTLEKYFTQKLIEEKNYNLIGSYWEKNNENEIDIVAVNELERIVLIAEVKRNRDKINLEKLKSKSVKLTEQFKGFTVDYLRLSLEEM